MDEDSKAASSGSGGGGGVFDFFRSLFGRKGRPSSGRRNGEKVGEKVTLEVGERSEEGQSRRMSSRSGGRGLATTTRTTITRTKAVPMLTRQ